MAMRSVVRKSIFLLLAILLSAPAVRRGAEVHIRFSGVICHVFDGAHAPRAVAMRGGGTMLHHAALHMAQESIASSEVAMACDNGDCVLELADTAVRFLGSGRPQFDESFDTIVPHLRAVTGGEMSALRHDVFDAVPSPNGVISAVMELPVGRMSATPFDTKARYEPDFENRGDRLFAREVALDGVVAAPVLLVRRAGDKAWRSVTFKDDIELRMVNEPAAGMAGMNHELLFYDLAARALATKPLIVSRGAVAGQRHVAETDSNCSDSHYP
jgi:hypothetical protein